MSGLESESESDVGDGVEIEEECIETPYVHCQEEEFGAVSNFYILKKLFCFIFYNNLGILKC